MVSLFPHILFISSFSVYLFTALPSIYWRDAPEFQAIGFLVDIAHPAGSPLYAVIAKLFTFIPFGSIAFKVTLVSCFFGAVISVLTYYILLYILEHLSRHKNEHCSKKHLALISLMTTLLFSFSNALWENATVPEVYTLQHVFTAAFIFIFLKVEQKRFNKNEHDNHNQFKWHCLLLFILGLGLGSHAILVLYVPFLFFWVYWVWWRNPSFSVLKVASICSFFFLIGFSIYLYLPIRSSQNPYYDWGNPETIENLLIHTSDRKTASYHFAVPEDVMPRQLSMYSQFFIEDFSYLGLIVGFTGLAALIYYREKKLLLFLSVIFFPPFLFFIPYWGEPSAFLSNFLIFDILMGVGFFVIYFSAMNFFKQKQMSTISLKLVVLLLGIQMLMLFQNHYKENNNGNYWKTRSVSRNLINDLPPNAIVISTLTWFMLSYIQQAEGYRPDVSIVSLSSFIAPDFFSKLEQSKFENIVIPKEGVSGNEFGSAFLSENVNRYPIYWETAGMQDYLVEKYLELDGFFLKVSATPSEITNEDIQAYFKNLGSQIQFEEVSDNHEERLLISEVVMSLGYFFMTRGVNDIAREHFHLALSMMPNQPDYINALGISYANLENYREAETLFLESISLNPNNYIPYLNLAKIYLHEGNHQKSEYYLTQVLRIYPNHENTLYLLGNISFEDGNQEKSLHYFRQVLTINPNNQEAKAKIAILLNES